MQTSEDSYIYEIVSLNETKLKMCKIITYSSFILNGFLKILVIQNNPNLSIYLSQSNHSVGGMFRIQW